MINEFAINDAAINDSDFIFSSRINNALAKLPEQFKQSSNLKNLIAIFIDELDEFEFVMKQVLAQKSIDSAIGAQLDQIGKDLGIIRPYGLSDNIYRTLIKTQIGVNSSKGLESEVLKLWKNMTGASVVELNEIFPAHVQLYANTTYPSNIDRQQITSVLPATVTAEFLFSSTTPFAFDGPDGLGWGDSTDLSLGGTFAGVGT